MSLPSQKKAANIILVQNNPSSGRLFPYDLDIDTTDHLIQVGIILNTKIEDHLIISENGYYSFKYVGLMRKLYFSSEYTPRFSEEDQISLTHQKIRYMELSSLRSGKKLGIQEGGLA